MRDARTSEWEEETQNTTAIGFELKKVIESYGRLDNQGNASLEPH